MRLYGRDMLRAPRPPRKTPWSDDRAKEHNARARAEKAKAEADAARWIETVKARKGGR